MKQNKQTSKTSEIISIITAVFLIGFFGGAVWFSDNRLLSGLSVCGLTLAAVGIVSIRQPISTAALLRLSALTAAIWLALPYISKWDVSWEDIVSFLPLLVLAGALFFRWRKTISSKRIKRKPNIKKQDVVQQPMQQKKKPTARIKKRSG